MIPELTVLHGIAVVVGLVGLTLIINGIRGAFLDEAAGGGLLLVITWWLL